ncbi:MAG: TOBE-like domain-containing protein [Candidatus Devosia symbiotica]|nr:TOBE-like domain-containing protein [Candidatus Devosia symbiotica]
MHDIELVQSGPALAGIITANHCVGGTRRVELALGAAHHVEIDLPLDHPAAEQTRIAFRLRCWQLFAAG